MMFRTSHTASLEMEKQFNYLSERFLHKIRLLIIICLSGHTEINGWEIMVTSLRTRNGHVEECWLVMLAC